MSRKRTKLASCSCCLTSSTADMSVSGAIAAAVASAIIAALDLRQVNGNSGLSIQNFSLTKFFG